MARASSSRLRKKPLELRNPLMAGHEMTGSGPAARGDSAAWWWAGFWSGRLACQVPNPHEIVDGGGKGEDPIHPPLIAVPRLAEPASKVGFFRSLLEASHSGFHLATAEIGCGWAHLEVAESQAAPLPRGRARMGAEAIVGAVYYLPYLKPRFPQSQCWAQ